MSTQFKKQNSKTTPTLRFSGFSGVWEHKPLNELLGESKKRNTDLKFDKNEVLSVSKEMGIVNQIEHLGRSYAGESVHNYHVVDTGDVVYTKSPLKANPYGIIKVNKGKAGIVSTLYAVYKVKETKAVGDFLDYYFSLDANTNRYLRPLVKKGAKNDMKINNDYVLHDKIFVPSVDEQKKIAFFLQSVDEWVNNLKAQKEHLVSYKKAIVEKIFSQEVRLKDSKGKSFPKWEQKKLGDLFTKKRQRNTDNAYRQVLTNSAVSGIVNQTDYFSKDIANHDNLTNYHVVDIDDFIYNPRISKSAPVGPLKRNKLCKGIMSPLYTVLKPKVNNLSFLECYFETDHWHAYMNKIANFGARHDRMNILQEDFMNMPIPFPTAEEQGMIADFLNSVEVMMKSKQEQISRAEDMKKGLMQQLFV